MKTKKQIRPAVKGAAKKSNIKFDTLKGKVYVAPDAFTKAEMRGYDFKSQPKPKR